MAAHAGILVIAPHPDDIEFGAAGAIARLIQEGKQAVYALCTSGDKGTSDRSITPEQLAGHPRKRAEGRGAGDRREGGCLFAVSRPGA